MLPAKWHFISFSSFGKVHSMTREWTAGYAVVTLFTVAGIVSGAHCHCAQHRPYADVLAHRSCRRR